MAIKAWEYPFSFGAPGNSALRNSEGFNVAMRAAYLHSMAVELPEGRIETAGGLLVMNGTQVRGAGTKHSYGTHLLLASGSNTDLLICGETGFDAPGIAKMWHGGLVEDIRLDANKAGNTVGSALVVNRFGETSELRRVFCENAADYNFNVRGSNAPGRMTNCSGMSANKALLRVEGGGLGVFLVDGLSGDCNNTFIRLEGQTTLVVLSPKVEGPYEWVFDIPNVLSSVTVVGGYCNRWAASNAVNSLFRIRAGGNAVNRPEINAFGMMQSRFRYSIVDEFSGYTKALTSQRVGKIEYVGTTLS